MYFWKDFYIRSSYKEIQDIKVIYLQNNTLNVPQLLVWETEYFNIMKVTFACPITVKSIISILQVNNVRCG